DSASGAVDRSASWALETPAVGVGEQMPLMSVRHKNKLFDIRVLEDDSNVSMQGLDEEILSLTAGPLDQRTKNIGAQWLGIEGQDGMSLLQIDAYVIDKLADSAPIRTHAVP